MKITKIKFFSILSIACLVLASFIIYIFAADVQYIRPVGDVEFVVADDGLYLQDVWVKEDSTSEAYSLKNIGEFSPGYMSDEFNVSLDQFVNQSGTLELYLDIINTMDENRNSYRYNISASTNQSDITVATEVLSDNDYIPYGSITKEEITPQTEPTVQALVTVESTAGAEIDLGQLLITITQIPPQNIEGMTFDFNGTDNTATLTEYTGPGGDVVIPDSISILPDGSIVEGSQYILKEVNDEAFRNCTNLTSITLPDDLDYIGASAFSGCSELTSISLPSSIRLINVRAFDGCNNIEVLEYRGTIEDYLAIDIRNEWIEDTSYTLKLDLNGDGEAEEVTSLVIPNGTTEIQENAFFGCSGLTSVTLPEGLTRIEGGAFRYCRGLTSVTLPEGLTSIGYDAFSSCSGLKTVVLPKTLTTIERSAFTFCTGLETLEYNGTVEEYLSIDMGYTWIQDESHSLKLDADGDGETEEVTSLVVPEGVILIPYNAFFGCTKITSVKLPESLIVVETNAFRYCASLNTLNINVCTNLESIGTSAFSDCSALTSVVLPVNLNSIGTRAFFLCNNLTSVEFTDPTGWQVSTSSSFSGSIIDIDEAQLQASSTASELLKTTYYNYYWRKVEG